MLWSSTAVRGFLSLCVCLFVCLGGQWTGRGRLGQRSRIYPLSDLILLRGLTSLKARNCRPSRLTQTNQHSHKTIRVGGDVQGAIQLLDDYGLSREDLMEVSGVWSGVWEWV